MDNAEKGADAMENANLLQESGRGLAMIRSGYTSLSQSERKVADYILANTSGFLYQSVNYVAHQCHVGESTVIRFCRSVGFSGFQEMKYILARDTTPAEEYPESEDPSHQDLSYLVRQLSEKTILGIKDTLQLLDLNELNRAIEAILKARRVEFYGVGGSGITALEAQLKFMRIGITAIAYTDAHLQAMSATTLGPEDVVVGISLTGALRDIVHSIELARDSKATVISITSVPGSPITEVSDIILINGGSERGVSSSLKGKIAQLHMIDFLFTGVYARLGEKGKYYSERTAKSTIDQIL